MTTYSTEQEAFWAGNFGDEYASRNSGENWIASNTALFSRILSNTHAIESVIELGSNIGLNLRAIRNLLPNVDLSAVEINEKAALQLRDAGFVSEVHQQSLIEFDNNGVQYDLVFTKGVLIHINPKKLADVYNVMYRSSRKYLVVAEYFNPTPTEVSYRGHENRLFKRDFAGEMLEMFEDLRVVDYGFTWKRDPLFPQDDINWFLLEKTC